MEALDYRPSGVARSLKLRSTRTLGLIVTDVQNPFFPELVRAVEDVAWKAGFGVFLCNAARDPEREASYLQLLEERRVEAVVVAANHVTSAHAKRLGRMPVPVVLVNCESSEVEVPTILSDNLGGGMLAADHLLAAGHSRIAALAGPPRHSDAPIRVGGVREALGRAGCDPASLVVVQAGATVDGGEAAARELLAVAPDVTGIACYNDLVAIGAVRALRAAGRDVPGDVSVVGFDDIDAAAWVDPPLTTVAQQKTAMGRWAVERVLRHLRDGGSWGPAERVVLPVTLVKRGSTAMAPPMSRVHRAARRAAGGAAPGVAS